MLPPVRVSSLAALVFFATACAKSTEATRTTSSCTGRVMAIVINRSNEAVEAVAVLGNSETVLALAPPGLTSRPFQPPRPSDVDFVRPGEARRSFWFVRDVATRRQIAPRDPEVRTDWVCVEAD
jgi:hypothetical protein